MKIFFGKISSKFDTKQIVEGYYQAPRYSTWYNGIEVGDYAFAIGGDRIQLWKAKAWSKMTTNENDKLEFEILISDTGLKIKDLIAFKFFKLTVDLIVKTTRSTGGEKKAFFELEMEPSFLEKDLLNPETYSNKDNFRNIRTFLPGQDINLDSYDVQLQFINGQLVLHPIRNCEQGIIDKYVDNTSKIGKGQPLKDKTLSILRASKNVIRPLDISIKDLYDAFMCKYKVITHETSYWVVNGYEQEKINYDLENDSYVMYFQYTVQKQGTVTQTLNTAKKIKPGDKVLLFNQNKFFAHSTFTETEVESTLETTLDDLLRNRSRNDDGEIVTFTDAPCVYEDLTVENGFNGEWGQRLSLEGWEDVNEEGKYISGITEHLGPSSIITNTIIQLKDKTFFDLVKKILSGEVENANEYKKMNTIVDLIKHKKQIILQGPPGTGKTFTAKDLSELLIFNSISSNKKEQKSRLEDSGRFSLVQFHPSFSYEDFVRGISAKSIDGDILYETENKILASFAKKALDNQNEASKEIEEFSREKQIEKLIFEFAESVATEISENEIYRITDSVGIKNVEEDAFRYSGDWATSRRMKFNDLVVAQLNKVKTRQDLISLHGVSGLAKQHASYFIKVLNMFQELFEEELKQDAETTVQKPELENFVLIIDEINRANLPSVLGELIYALEYRNEAVQSIYALDGDNSLIIPENLYIIGTMNTADRSVGHIDYAIKRRFAFVDVLPNEEVIKAEKAKELFRLVSNLFIKEDSGKKVNSDFLASDFDFKDVQLGHSYFILKDGTQEEQKNELELRLKYEIVPILNEYMKDGLLLESAKDEIEKIANFEC